MLYPLLTIHSTNIVFFISRSWSWCSTMIGSSWIDTRPHSRLHSMWIGSLSSYVLFGNTLDMGMWADRRWTDGRNVDRSSIVGWCWWGRPRNSGKNSSALCLSGSQDLGPWGGVSSSDDDEGGESVTPCCLCWCLSDIELRWPVSGWALFIGGWRGEWQ